MLIRRDASAERESADVAKQGRPSSYLTGGGYLEQRRPALPIARGRGTTVAQPELRCQRKANTSSMRMKAAR